MPSAIEPVTALERSYEELTRVVEGLTPDQLAEPTCCSDWDVRGILNHVLGAVQMYVAANDGVLVGEDGGDLLGDDPRLAVARAHDTNISSWSAPGAFAGQRTYPFGTLPAAAGLISNVGEVAVHAWDVASATGQAARIDHDVAALVLAFYQQVPMDHLRAHGVYGPELDVPETASAPDRLLAFLSRKQS
jgi:uncharacterized protein (TIGR03086 family)